ncbi:ABC transporter permease [Rhodocytophaga aerolata]|uniref:ABC transporter permease n=1 Tax=Rhodocytophaga aerolata TaxID=455078 RepID=A0ABT8RF10_9BACT|nr:ABC transporter permease [Rhodocytophaga aerolata]MDO1449307.1 ABC transporter permease [Rhodocytophaga aerolata]
MKFLEIFRFEFIYQVRRPFTWLFVIVLLVLSFLMARDGSLSEVLYADFFLNSPFAIAKTTVFGSLIWLVMAGAIAGDAAARDRGTGMHPLTYTAPISKATYLGGRFLAALTMNALILLAVQAGILLGVYLPGVDKELIGPFRPAAFLTAYAYIALPNAFVATAIQFFMAVKMGRGMASYVGSFLLVFMGFFVASLLLFNRGLGTLLDPIGIRFVVEDIAHLWTPIEKNRRLLELEGIVLTNRLFWISIALVTIAITYLGFRFTHHTGNINFSLHALGAGWWKRITPFFNPFSRGYQSLPANFYDMKPHSHLSGHSITDSQLISLPQFPRTFGFATHTRQTLVIAWASFRAITGSWAGIALLIGIPLLTVPVILDQMQSNGVPLLPTTPLVIAELTAPMSDELSRWVIIPFLIVFFAGELIWRERDAGLGEITASMPGSEWAPLLGKFLGLTLVLVLFMAMQATAGILAQLIMGYQKFEIGLYLKILLGLQLTDYLLFALLALVVHVVADQKYTGHLVAIMTFVFITLSSLFGVEHNLLVYSASPGWTYTEMRGFGPSIAPWLWFKFYWAAWAVLFAVIAKLLWVRGKETSLQDRFQIARYRLGHSTRWVAGVALVFILWLGGFIFYNTNILNEYLNTTETKERAASYEQRYGRYATYPQPHLTATKLLIEIYPEQRSLGIRGTYRLVNRSGVAIDSIHIATVPEVENRALTFDRSSTGVLTDKKLHHRIYVLEKPLAPNDSLQLNFQVHIEPQGFRENGIDASVVANGTYFTNGWLPTIGYKSSRELIIASDRREHGLVPRPLIASLYDVEARKDRGQGSTFEAVIGTDKNQVVVAPGAIRRTWTEEERRYFHYSTNGLVGNEYAFFSANYAVHEVSWKNPDVDAVPSLGDSQLTGEVKIRIFHHPAHTAHLNRMVQSIRASLDYYTAQFGPYRRNYLSVVEGPGNGTGMHAEAGMITHAEGFTFWNPEDDPESHDHPFAIVAHEMAHQWTVPYANVEGAPVMSESLAWYYGMKAVEHARGRRYLRHLLNFMHQPHPYPAIRRGEPLLRGLDPYLSYRRGPFALFALSEYVGEEQVNRALRLLLEKHRQKEAPLATTLDLYRELQAVTPDSLHYLLHDLFEVNTYWMLETKRATTKQTSSGIWEVALDIESRKLVHDSTGVETEVPMDDWIEVGVFPPAKEDEPGPPLYLQKHRIRSGKQTILLQVSEKPARAGIDPNQLLIDLDSDNNIRHVKIE